MSWIGGLDTAYRACLWSRVASRVLLTLGLVPAADAGALYEGVRAMPWEDLLAPDGTLAVDFTGSNDAIAHTLFGAQKVKDAVVDRFRERSGRRPSVDLARPDLRLNVHLAGAEARVSIDLSGASPTAAAGGPSPWRPPSRRTSPPPMSNIVGSDESSNLGRP